MFNMKYHAVIEKGPDESVVVTLASGIDRSKFRKTILSRVHFSDERTIEEVASDFYSKLPPLKVAKEDHKTKFEYKSHDGISPFPFFVNYFSKISHKTGSLWIEC